MKPSTVSSHAQRREQFPALAAQAYTAKAWAERQPDALWAGGAQAVAEAVRGLPQAEAAAPASDFAENAGRMRDAAFRAQGLPIGSGLVERGCRTVIRLRLCRGWERRWHAAAMLAA